MSNKSFDPDLDCNFDPAIPYETYVEQGHSCGYIDGRVRQDLRLTFQKAATAIERLQIAEHAFESGWGFEGGTTLFSNQCPSCTACVSIRYPVQEFRRSKSQQDLWKAIPLRQTFRSYGYMGEEHFREHLDIADRYFAERFPKDREELATADRLYGPMYLNPQLPFTVFELRSMTNRLIAGSIALETENSFFGIMYYYDTRLMHLQPGRQMLMTLFDEAKRMGKTHFYVGPWNPHNSGVANKTGYRPYELFINGEWRRFDTPHPKF